MADAVVEGRQGMEDASDDAANAAEAEKVAADEAAK
jgi:hypothetical protein